MVQGIQEIKDFLCTKAITTSIQKKKQRHERGYAIQRNPLLFMVGGTGFEPVTSTV